MAAHQQLTNEWWALIEPQVDCFISPFVIQEVSAGDNQAANERKILIKDIPVLELNQEIQELAQTYFDTLDIPQKARLDASPSRGSRMAWDRLSA
ncbi:hypothetical protein MJD09_22400 [bacterium]|nr:hypothetical protein [bacterium]